MQVTHIQLEPKAVYRLLTDSKCMATVLHAICLAKYGEDIYQVEPLELYQRLEEDFGVAPTEENENKLSAILMATATDIFYEQPEAFRSISLTLADGDPGIDMLEEPTLAEMAWSIFEVELNHGPAELSRAVHRLVSDTVQNESDDTDFTEDPNESLKGYMRESHERLTRQMQELGVPAREIPPLDSQPALEPIQA